MKKFLLLLLLLIAATAALYSAENEYIWWKWTHSINDIAFHPNSQIFATAGGREIKIWDLEGNELKNIDIPNNGDGIVSLEFSKDGKYLAVGSYGSFTLLKTEDWSIRTQYTGCSRKVSFSYDDKLAAASFDGGRVIIYNVETGEYLEPIIYTPGEQEIIEGIRAEFTQDGKYLLVRGQKDLLIHHQFVQFYYLYNALNYSLISDDYVSWSALSHDGKYLAETLIDKTNIREVETKSIVLSIPMAITIENIYKVRFSPDDKYLITGGSDLKVNIWKIENGEKIYSYQTNPPYGISGISISNDKKYIAAASGVMLLLYSAHWDTGPVIEQNQNETTIIKIYPNPSNDTIIIEYQLEKPGNTKISISDNTGKIITILVNEFMDSGIHSLQWNIEEMPSGVYYIKLTTIDKIDSQKIIISK